MNEVKTDTDRNLDNLVKSFVEVTFTDANNFLKIKETLTRIGIASIKLDEATNKQVKTLFQSCHILHKRDKYYIVHFKELYALDQRETNFSDDDKARRNTIAKLLEEWGLLKIVDPSKVESPIVNLSQIKVLTFNEKKTWRLSPKYMIGKVKKRAAE